MECKLVPGTHSITRVQRFWAVDLLRNFSSAKTVLQKNRADPVVARALWSNKAAVGRPCLGPFLRWPGGHSHE